MNSTGLAAIDPEGEEHSEIASFGQQPNKWPPVRQHGVHVRALCTRVRVCALQCTIRVSLIRGRGVERRRLWGGEGRAG